MSRLPQPGGDDGDWGDVLNDFLNQSHKTDGSLKDGIVTSTKLASNAVDNANIIDGTIASTKLVSAVQTKINGAIQTGAAAGGDLSGTLPNPAVAKLNGIAVTGTPTTGQVLTATGTTAAAWSALPTPTTTGYQSLTVAAWEASKGANYVIAHRGSVAVMPENTMESFDYAYAMGARIAEVSVGVTSDGELILMHDLTFDRTTNMTGTIAKIPSTALNYARVTNQPQLGPLYSGTISGYPGLKIPLFEDILRRFGGKMILLCEAKYDGIYPQMVALIEKYGLKNSVIIKAYFTNTARISQAKTAGYKVYSYFGTNDDNTTPNLNSMVSLGVDYLAIYAYQTGLATTPIATVDINRAVSASPSTMKVWAYSIQRRVDRDYFYANGCEGIIADNVGYLSNDAPIAVADTWATKAVAPGELSQRPEVSPGGYLSWTGTNQLTTDAGVTNQSFVCLGQMAPLANRAGTYHINVDFQWPTLPTDTSQNITICFGNADDTYYQHANGDTSGYHAIIRASGLVQLYSHTKTITTGTQIGTSGVSMAAAAVAGTWYHATIDVTPTTITFTVNDGANHVVTATNNTYRGGYIHLGKSLGLASFRNFAIT